MKKFIILGLVVLFVFLSAQGLYKINKPTRVSGWIKIGGDFMPIWTEKYDIGDSAYWFDSSFIAHGWFKYLRVDSGGYLKLDSADYSTLTADSINAGKVVVEDTTFTDFIASNDSDVINIGADGLTETDSIQINEYIKGEVTATGTGKIDISTATADTGLVITIDTLTGGSDVVHDGVIIKGTGYKNGTQYFLKCYDRTDNIKFYINGVGNFWGKGNLGVNGQLTLADAANLNGKTNLGDAHTDTVTVTGAMKLTTAVIDSVEENGAQDTLFIYVGGGRKYCLPLAP